MTQFLILFIFAILVEAIINMTIGDVATPKWVKKVAAIVLGIGVCIVYRVGLIALLGVEGGIPVVDYIATGIIISRGSNFLSDLLTRIKGGNTTTTVTTTPVSSASSTTTTTETAPIPDQPVPQETPTDPATPIIP